MKHTPGPWTDQVMDGSQWGVYAEDGSAVAQAQQRVRPRDELKQLERTANARLISAAPELLAALQHAVVDGELMGWDMGKARAAIAKATGEPS